MKYLSYILCILLVLSTPAIATPQSPHLDELTGDELCQLVQLELLDAVDAGILSDSEADLIITRCFALSDSI